MYKNNRLYTTDYIKSLYSIRLKVFLRMIIKKVEKKMPDEVIKLGTRISEIIKEKKYKTREVAHDADMDVENLRKYIKGRQEMRVTTLIKIAKSLDVSMEELFTFLKSKKRK